MSNLKITQAIGGRAMRLIDEAALINEAETGSWDIDLKELKMILKYVPTIDAVPVRRGEWILQGKNEHDYETSLEEKCSLCGRYVYRYDTQPQDNCCPNCGADMRRESEVKE